MRITEGINPWHFLWIGIIFSEFFTFIMNSILSFLWWNHVSKDLLIIGSIDAFVVAFLVSFLVIYFIKKINEKEVVNRQLAQEIKTLHGFLPICSSCKDIRDAKGVWNKMESYISKHSEAKFTHSYCDDCIRKLYPDMADEILG